ncbi:hypothetical protein MCOR25_007562 [Pyricularia grisea]|nr:hypothetical protein MCOR25_007562 [Pyricularia grisea]
MVRATGRRLMSLDSVSAHLSTDGITPCAMGVTGPVETDMVLDIWEGRKVTAIMRRDGQERRMDYSSHAIEALTPDGQGEDGNSIHKDLDATNYHHHSQQNTTLSPWSIQQH